MRTVCSGDRVRVNYTGKLADGRVFDTTDERGPQEIEIGAGKTLLKFEQALVGMAPGESREVVLAARDAFGKHQRTLLRVLKKELFAPGQKVKAGQRLRIDQGDGTHAVVKVTRVVGDEVMVDMNHPLADQDLTFAVDLLEILDG